VTATPDHVGYLEVRRNVRALLAGHPGTSARTVPACPEWTVVELLAHLVEISERMLARFGAAIPPRGVQDVDALLDRWDELGADVDSLLAEAGGGMGDVAVMDAYTHELDLCAALGAPGAEQHPARAGSFAVVVRGFAGAVAGRGLPAVLISDVDGDWVAGAGEPVITLSGPPGDLYRSLAGRRTLAQITALGWTADPEPWLPAFTWGPFVPPGAPVE
jgi:uncharacterized protein (TIGR03083 family)